MKKKNMKLTQISFDYCRFLKIFVPLVSFSCWCLREDPGLVSPKKITYDNTVDNYIDKRLSMENTLNNV